MKFVVFLVVLFVAVVSAQFGDFYGGGVYGPEGISGFAPFAASVRDPRQNTGTGPVVFPPSPPGNPADSSGVVVGASGYGFVPPSNQGYFNRFGRFGHRNYFFK